MFYLFICDIELYNITNVNTPYTMDAVVVAASLCMIIKTHN